MSMAQDLTEDIIYPIFLHALPCEIPSTLTPSILQSLPPFNFSLVCRSWRLVTLTHPRLWSALSSSAIVQSHYPLINSLLEYWFFRGGAAPLNLCLGKVYRPMPETPKDLLGLVFRESYRWKKIKMVVTPMDLAIPNPPLTFRCSTLLTSLELLSYPRVGNTDLVVGYLDLTDCTAQVASQLRVLEMSALMRWIIPESGIFFLPNLQCLNLTIDSDIQVDAILAACPKISSLSIKVGLNASQSSQRVESVNLPHLTNFYLITENDAFTSSLLTRLLCTSLAHFDYTSWVYALELRTIANFLSNSRKSTGCSSLEELNIIHRGAQILELESQSEFALTLKNILSPLVNLKQLFLNGVFANKEIIEFLTPRAGAMHVCPSLTRIFMVFHFQESGDLSWYTTLEDFVISRWNSRKGGLTIELRSNGFVKFSEESQRIRQCVEEGLIRKFCATDF